MDDFLQKDNINLQLISQLSFYRVFGFDRNGKKEEENS